MLGFFDRFLSLTNLLNEALGLTINDGGARKCGPDTFIEHYRFIEICGGKIPFAFLMAFAMLWGDIRQNQSDQVNWQTADETVCHGDWHAPLSIGIIRD